MEFSKLTITSLRTNWDVNELTGKLIKEENRLKNVGSHSVNLVQGAGVMKALKSKASKNFKKRKGHTNVSHDK